MITITAKGTEVIVTIDGQYPVGGTLFPFSFNTDQEYTAKLLAYNLEHHLYDKVEKARKEAYERGWSDAKKHKLKAKWFSGEIEAGKYPIG